MCVQHVCAQGLCRSEEGIISPGTVVTGVLSHSGCSTPNLDPLKEQQAVLASEPSAQCHL